jgi:mRNA interferase RelE/StbE
LGWTIRIDERALRALKKLDQPIQREITNYLRQRIAKADNPRSFGKALREDKSGLWRYRVRDYRIICKIKDRDLVVLVVGVGHRSTIYDE